MKLVSKIESEHLVVIDSIHPVVILNKFYQT